MTRPLNSTGSNTPPAPYIWADAPPLPPGAIDRTKEIMCISWCTVGICYAFVFLCVLAWQGIGWLLNFGECVVTTPTAQFDSFFKCEDDGRGNALYFYGQMVSFENATIKCRELSGNARVVEIYDQEYNQKILNYANEVRSYDHI